MAYWTPARRAARIARNHKVVAVMTPRTLVSNVTLLDGPIFMEASEEGPQETYLIQIGAMVSGREYVLRDVTFRPSRRYDAQVLADKIADRGTVNLALWVELPPRMSLEERFAVYAQNEAEVRMGFRDEADLYHGV